MGASYILTRQELTAASLIRRGEKNHFWDAGEEEALDRLMQKEYLIMDGDTFLLDPLMELFASIVDEPCSEMTFEQGRLYSDGKVWLWIQEDPRRLSGILLYPYPSLASWYEEWGSTLSKEYNEIRKELDIDG